VLAPGDSSRRIGRPARTSLSAGANGPGAQNRYQEGVKKWLIDEKSVGAGGPTALIILDARNRNHLPRRSWGQTLHWSRLAAATHWVPYAPPAI